MFTNPVWFGVTYLFGRARQRARAALDGNPESGALTLEWIIIAGILVGVAVAATAFFKGKITEWEGQVQ
jgi:hypothetical protein